MEKSTQKDPDKQPKPFANKFFLIWFAAIILLIAVVMANSKEISSPHRSISSVDELFIAADEGRITEAYIQSDPKGGEEWYSVRGYVDDPAFDIDKEGHGTLPFSVKGRITADEYTALRELLKNNLTEEPSSTIWTDLLFSLLPFLLIIGLLYFLFVRQLRMAGKGALSFGKSKAKLLTRENEKVVFDNVAGCDEAKEEVSEIVDFLKDPKRFRKIGGTIPKGVLMVGPPGTGKTLLAKAVAGEAEVPFFSISGSDFVEMFVGVGAARVRDMFEQGRKSAPCLIFIDEIDAVGRQRGAGLGGGNDEREQTLNSLLVEMDGFDGHEGVIIIAATNRPDVLDNALLRPGRFDRQVVIDLPDLEGREQILKVHAKKIKLCDDVELVSLARATSGFSGADLANLLNEDGVSLIHTIGSVNPPRDPHPWITKYIFPGGYTPSLSEVTTPIERAGLVVTDIEVLRLHYSHTLRHWKENCTKNKDKIIQMFDEKFFRMWEFYLAGCEMAFKWGDQVVYQFQLTKNYKSIPVTRDYIYQ